MDRRDTQLLCCLLLCIITQVWCQLCTGPCQCPPTMPRCPVGVPLMFDSCGCCQVCARQEGEACTDRMPCDTHRGLQCDYSASFPGGPGQCVGRNELGCEINGRRLEEGQVFQPSCAQLCHCLGGGVTCVPLCSDDLQRPADNCPNPQLVRLPGHCCKEWVCDSLGNSIPSNPSTAEQPRQDYGGGLSGPSFGSITNCIEQTSDWSPCSHSCGPGVSTRTTNRNWACRPQTETRLCQVRPCQGLLPGLRRLQPNCRMTTNQSRGTCLGTVTLLCDWTAGVLACWKGSGVCESSYISPRSIQLEQQGCWSTRAYRPRFCAMTCLEGRCCSPSLTRTVWMVFRCPLGGFTQQQVMMIESCSCSISNCRQSPAAAARSIFLPWL